MKSAFRSFAQGLVDHAAWWRPAKPSFRCNVCGRKNANDSAVFSRETPSCSRCGSSVRLRSIVHALSCELFGESLALPAFPKRKDLEGLGMSDWAPHGKYLAKKLAYRNTFLHQKPKLDITKPDPALFGTLDFLLSTDVFEHVEPPVSLAFENARKLLKPGGVVAGAVYGFAGY